MNGQLNVTPIESKQPQAQCRFSIQVSIQGFPVTIEGEGRAGDLKLIVDRLVSIGAQPPASFPQNEGSKKTAPTCPVHNGAMKASQKPGTFFCPKRNEDGSYCRHKA